MQIRTFNPPHDLDLMTSILLEGFDYPENPEWNAREDEKQGMLERAQSVKRAWPILRLLQIISPLFRDALRGFIAQEQGVQAGLINYSRQRNEPEWYIANVTVLPAFRRRGLARQLVEKTLNDLRARKAKTALLEVVDGNLPAIKLYESLGFETFTGSLEMDLEAGVPVPVLALPDGFSLRPLSRWDWRTGFALAEQVTPENVRRFEPVSEARYRAPFVRVFIGLFFENIFGNKSRKIALHSPDGKVIGLGRYEYRVRAGGLNHLEITLAPAYSAVARAFLAHMLGAIRSLSAGRRTELSVAGWQAAISESAEALGCVKRFGVKRMGLRL